jgi:transcriptional regulator with XRE-family HTH domain
MTEPATAIVAAAESGNTAEVLRLARKTQRLTQGELGQRCGCGQSTISRIERGTYKPDMTMLRCLAQELGIPAHFVGLTELHSAGEDPVKRRDFLAAAAAVVVSSPVKHGELEQSLAAIHTITTAQRRLDATTPSRDLADPVMMHLQMVTRRHAASQTPYHQQHIAAAVSEIAGFAAWLHWDMNDLGSARRYYATAIRAANGSQDKTLHAYMLGSLATLAVYDGDAAEGLALLRRATGEIGPKPPAVALAWLSSLEAVAQADAQNARRSWEALDRAETAVEQIKDEQPPWPWVFQFDHGKVARYRLTCAARLKHPEAAYTAARAIEAFLQTGHSKQRALAQLDLATAYLADGEIDEAFRIASGAVALGQDVSSGRVLSAARQFRRSFTGSPASPVVRQFDEHLYHSNL